MVQNGYILHVSTAGLPAFLHRVRSELKAVTREGILSQVTKSVEMLYDMKFVEGRKYESSILDQVLSMVAGRISGVALGAFRDDRFDFRANLIIAKAGDNDAFQYVLLNTDNPMIRHYWDNLPEVQDYRFDATVGEDDPEFECNAERGHIWHSIFEKAGWNIHLTGYAAQLSVQPKLEDLNISVEDLKDYFSDADIRSWEYVKNSVALSKVKALVGNTPIEQINPYTLLEYFIRGLAYAETRQGKVDAKKLYDQIGKAFGPVMLDTLTLSD